MLDCMDAQGVLAQNRTIPPFQIVCYLSVIFDDSVPDRIKFIIFDYKITNVQLFDFLKYCILM